MVLAQCIQALARWSRSCSTIAAAMLVVALAACGGAPGERGSAASATTDRPSIAPGPALAAAMSRAEPERPLHPTAGTPGAQPLLPGSYTLLLLNSNAVHRDGDELAPTHGAGYQALRAFVYVGGQPRSRSPVAGVKPYCATPSKCEYLPPRKGGVPEKFTIALDGDSVATLSASEDLVVIRARQLALQEPQKVTVTLSMPGQSTVTRQIVYAKAGS
jgi:hypothetical protein